MTKQFRGLANYPQPFVIAHRGSSNVNPENSLSGFNNIASINLPVELDCITLTSTEELGVMHDSTVNRTTSSTGTGQNLTLAQWQALRLDPTTYLGAGYSDTEPPPIFSDVCGMISHRGIILPEAKNAGSGALIAAHAKRIGLKRNQMIVQSFSLPELVTPARYGYDCLYLISLLANVSDWQAIKDLGISFVGYGENAAGDETAISNARAVGIGIIRYTVNCRAQFAYEVSLGCVGVMSDEAEYLSRTTALATRDTFTADGKWMSGMVANNSNRGLIYAGHVWGYEETVAAAYSGALMGWACPLATPTNFTLTFTAKHESLLSGDTTRWISVFICADDDTEHKDLSTDQVSGYHILIRASGTMQIYKKAKGVAIGTPLASTTSTAFTIGDFVTFTVVVTPTELSITRSDVAQTTTLTDSTYRGGYFHLGRNGCLAKFKDVIIT